MADRKSFAWQEARGILGKEAPNHLLTALSDWLLSAHLKLDRTEAPIVDDHGAPLTIQWRALWLANEAEQLDDLMYGDEEEPRSPASWPRSSRR